MAAATFAAIALEWRSAPRGMSPLVMRAGQWMWCSFFAAAALGIALLAPIQQGRLLLKITLSLLTVFILLTLVRLQALAAMLVLAWLLALGAGMGHAVLRLFLQGVELSRLERLLLSAALGIGMLSLIGLILALTWQLNAPMAYAVLGLLSFAARNQIRASACAAIDGIRSAQPNWQTADLRLPAAVVAMLALCFAGGYVWALADDIGYDSMMYHLAFPALYAKFGGLVERPEAVHSYFCHNAEMLYSLAMVLVGQPLPQLIHLASGLLVTALVWCLGRRLVGSTTGWLAALIFYALPIVTWESQTAKNDLLVALHVLTSIYLVTIWWQHRCPRLLALAGVFSGLAAGTKLSGLFIVVPMAGILATAIMVERLPWRKRAVSVLLFLLPILLGAGPWLLIDWLRTGNPVFPFFNGVFQSPKWSPVNESFDFQIFGVGKSVGAFLSLPWRLTSSPQRFDNLGWGTLEGLPLAALPATALLWPRQSIRVLWFYFALILGSFIFWFFEVQYVRYLLPLFPLMALLAAANITTVWAHLVEHSRKPRLWPALLLLIGLTWFAATRCWSLKSNWQIPEHYPFRLAFGLETSEHFLRRALPEYDALRFLDEQSEHRAFRVLEYPRHHRLYGGTCVFYHRIFSSMKESPFAASAGPDLARILAESQIDYILINCDANYRVANSLRCGLTDPEFLRRYCREEIVRRSYPRREARLYRFLGTDAQLSSTP
jgi:hypothetical protein